MKPQEVANVVWSFATLNTAPSRDTLRALEAAALKLAHRMIPSGTGVSGALVF